MSYNNTSKVQKKEKNMMKLKKKIALPLSTLVLACGLMAGCEKDISPVFYLEVENVSDGTKMQVNGLVGARWVSGDKININGTEKTIAAGTYNKASVTGIDRSSFYRAIFPASIVTSGNGTPCTVTLPSTYTYQVVDGYQKLDLPMAAYLTDDESDEYALYFKHLTGSVVVRVSNPLSNTLYIDRVTISSDKYSICGRRTIDMEDIETSASVAVEGTDTVVSMLVNGEVSLASGESVDIQIPIAPVGSDNHFTVKVSSHYLNTEGRPKYWLFEKRQQTGGSIARTDIAYAVAAMNSTNCYQDLPMDYVDGYYIIKTPSDYATFVDAVNTVASGRDGNFRNKNFKLGANINMSGLTVEPANDFRGVFDGNGKTISNLNVSTSNYTNVGMFGEYTQAAAPFVTNLTVNGITLQYTGSTEGKVYMGGIAGSVKGDNTTKITNCTVKNVNFITPGCNAVQLDFGGIVGNVSSASNSVTISGCTVNKINVNNDANKKPYVGGIVGYPLGAVTLTNCTYTSGTVTIRGLERFGGFIAWTANNVTFNNCSASLNITINGGSSASRIGGIIGSYNKGTRTATYNGCTVSGTINVTNTNITQKGVRYGFSGSGLTESGAPTTSLTIN